MDFRGWGSRLKKLRVARRMALGGGILAVSGLLFLAGLPLRALAPARHPAYRRWAFRWSCRALLWMLDAHVEVSGRPPRPPFLLVANHLSYLDILVLASQVPHVFLSKAEVKKWPGIGPLCRAAGTLFIDRAARRDIPVILAQLEAVLDRGEGVIFFPEATSSPGAGLLPFRSPLLALPARRSEPVHYAVLHYRTTPGSPPAQRSVAWAGNVPFAPHVLGLLALPRIDVRLDFGPEPVIESDRKRLAERLFAAISERFEPLEGDGLAEEPGESVGAPGSLPESP
jgi:1-acyl-sn-glycerol-3-phosphate acyltransferase